jgi:hypothetical protein
MGKYIRDEPVKSVVIASAAALPSSPSLTARWFEPRLRCVACGSPKCQLIDFDPGSAERRW